LDPPVSQTDLALPPLAINALPRRTRLTISNGEGKPILRHAINDTDRTWLTILPLESHCCAARLGFANPFAEPMPIIGASIYPSASYNPVPDARVAGTSIGTPSGGRPGTTVLFDRVGLDSTWINTTGEARGLILPGDPANRDNRARAFTITWSDWVPIRSVPRTDGRAQPLLFVYVALASGSMSTAGFGPDPFVHATSPGCRGRVAVSLKSDRPGDWTANPAGSAWRGATPAPQGGGSQWGLSPLLCLQYLSVVPGIQGVISGDSLMSGPGGPHGDAFSAAPIRAAYDLSSPSLPVCMAHLACGGAASSVYNDTLWRNMDALRPSFLVLQPLSRNDGMEQSRLDALFARLLATADRAATEHGASTMFQGAYPIPSVDPTVAGHGAELAAWQDIRLMLADMAAAGVPVYDAAGVMGEPAAPWRYASACSDDGTHPNDHATELATPIARALLERMLPQR